MSSTSPQDTADESGKLARQIEYLQSQVQHLQADHDALKQQLNLAEHAGIVNKVDALNRLTHGLAHDLNNLLTPIIACSHLIKEEPGATPGIIDSATQMIETGDRLIALARKLHSLYPKATKRFQSVDLNAQVKLGIDAVRPEMGDQVTVSSELDPKAGVVQADTGLIEKILRELCINAREAMPCGGALTITTTASEQGAVLTIRDQGEGMKPEVRARLYEPYFTTKEPSRGRGFGLAVTYGNVLRCGATIFCDTEPGKGTEFRICFKKVP